MDRSTIEFLLSQKGVFITATGTEVGKTFVACRIAKRMKERGVDVGVLKPVSSGGISDILHLKKAAQVTDRLDLLNPIRFQHPLAPSSASSLERKKFSLKKVLSCYEALSAKHSFMIVEGIGGVRVPLDSKLEVTDLIQKLKLPAIVVTTSKLGTINHTLLTLDYLQSKNIRVLGIIVNFYNRKSLVDRTNLLFFKKKRIPILETIPTLV